MPFDPQNIRYCLRWADYFEFISVNRLPRCGEEDAWFFGRTKKHAYLNWLCQGYSLGTITWGTMSLAILVKPAVKKEISYEV